MAYKYRLHQREGVQYKRAGRTIIAVNSAIPGRWNFIDDRTGFKCKNTQAHISWDGFLTSDDIIEPRTPQDFVRAVQDQKPLSSSMIRIELPFQFGSQTEAELINDLLLRK